MKNITIQVFNNYQYTEEPDESKFFEAISDISNVIFVDARLHETHNFTSYILPDKILLKTRSVGINTHLIGYKFNSKYYVHKVVNRTIIKLTNIFRQYNLEVVRPKIILKKYKPKIVKRIC